MYRDHVWTSTLRRLLVAHMNTYRSQLIPLLGILLLCSSFGWSQSYTFVAGSASACPPGHHYKKLGFGAVSGKTSDSCSRGAATASSKASFVTKLVSLIHRPRLGIRYCCGLGPRPYDNARCHDEGRLGC
jgi:hypothetical protein